MAVARPILGLLALILLAGGILLQFLVILSGAVGGNPENRIWFLQSTTNGITGAPNPARWTFFSVTGVGADGRNANYGSVKAALPFNPPQNFGTTTGVPQAFLGTHKYYYLSRFMFAFFLIALFFAVCALFTGLLALCTRFGSYLSGLNTMLAFFFQALAASLMTAWTVLGRNHFNSSGQTARLGSYAYGFTWAPVLCFLLSTVLYCIGGRAGKDNYSKRSSTFGRKRSTRSRGSFIDTESQRRVKDEYE
ncbi:Eisosomes component [Taxawa tesnikishii (nom. ined.)]|nr:Eisosomes component [Dothideales sp. JES 119]